MVIGTPGSGKSYAIVNSYIRQLIAKGFAIYIYDYKFDDLSTIAYNSLLKIWTNTRSSPGSMSSILTIRAGLTGAIPLIRNS